MDNILSEITKKDKEFMEFSDGENFDNVIKSFIIDLVEEGFEVNDVREFVNERVENIFKDFKNY